MQSSPQAIPLPWIWVKSLKSGMLLLQTLWCSQSLYQQKAFSRLATDSSVYLRIKSINGDLLISGLLEQACMAPTVLFTCLNEACLICGCCLEWSRAAALSQRGKSQRAQPNVPFMLSHLWFQLIEGMLLRTLHWALQDLKSVFSRVMILPLSCSYSLPLKTTIQE